MNGFNLVMLLLVSLQASPLVLATAQVEGIHRVENALRERYGLRIESSGVVGLRRALLALREGRIVATGVDRPDPRGWSLQFFGQPACLPVGHIRLAMRVGAPVFAARVLPIGSGLYQLEGEVLDVRPVRVEEAALVVTVAEKVLQVMESSIRQRPDAWLMFERVWPDSVRSSPAAPAFGL
jgi:KDO2-lipid IV(A) lauroyltransferase